MAKRSWTWICLLASATMVHAQASPTASRAGDLQIGIAYALANPDYGTDKFKGIAAYTDFDFSPHFGVEAEFRFLQGPSPLSMYEKTYEIGGRYHRDYGRFAPYAKLMVGRGVYNYQYSVANLAYNMFALGAGTDYRIKRYITIRGDFEYQHWAGFPPDGLTPTVGTVGVAYHFH